jgi:hypothetical protein
LDHVAGVVSRLERATIGVPLAVLAAVFDRLGHHEPAATIAGFAISPFTAATTPELTNHRL